MLMIIKIKDQTKEINVKIPASGNTCVESKCAHGKARMLCHKTAVFHSGFMGGSVFSYMCLYIQHYPLQNSILISRIVVKSTAEFRL